MGSTLDAGQLQRPKFWQSQVLCIAVYRLVTLDSVFLIRFIFCSILCLADLLIIVLICVQAISLASNFHKFGTRRIDIVD